jgi:glutamyl-tRNA reductase
MLQYSNIHQTSNFAVLSISYEKADVETRGKFAFFDENIKNFVSRVHQKILGMHLWFPHVTGPRSIPLHPIIF